ncbi:MAG: hypothetical protein SGARI_008261, partial [Bacillariaceae sp.]
NNPTSTANETPISSSIPSDASQENTQEDEASSTSTTQVPSSVSSDTAMDDNDKNNNAATTGANDHDDDANFAPDAYEWPILVAMDGQQAAALLEEHYPGFYDIYVLPEDSVVSMDYDVYRIRIFVNTSTSLVVKAPMIG